MFYFIFTAIDLSESHFCKNFTMIMLTGSEHNKESFLFYLKGCLRSQDIHVFVVFSLPFHIFQIQKDK